MEVQGWSHAGTLFERYAYAPGPAEGPEKHVHDSYQFGLSLDSTGGYTYLGRFHHVPKRAVSIVHPGEVHQSRGFAEFRVPATFHMAYVNPGALQNASEQVAGCNVRHEPFFPSSVVRNKELIEKFLKLHLSSAVQSPDLEKDELFFSLLTLLVSRYAEKNSAPRELGKERRAVRLVREYLEDNLTENVRLEELAHLADLSPYHLSRVFREEVGLPPHRYQVQVRVERAKELLVRGWSLSRVVAVTGFADPSHLSRYFKRLVGVPPGSYARHTGK